MRLIYADRLYKRIHDEYVYLANQNQGSKLQEMELAYCCKMVEEEPTVNPILYGEWKTKYSWGALYCTNCGEICRFTDDKYCYNCGAKMKYEKQVEL
jgi:hypothetical protein